MNEFVEVVMTETDINARAAMYDAIIFSQLILGRIGYKELDENIEWIREVGYNLGLGVIQCDEDALRLFEKASTACLNCIDAFAAGKCSPEHWGLTLGEYMLFNRITNANSFRMLCTLGSKYIVTTSNKVAQCDQEHLDCKNIIRFGG